MVNKTRIVKFIYCRELTPGTVSLTDKLARHYNAYTQSMECLLTEENIARENHIV